jgi:DNA-binding IclR family transcriptional regulator
MSGPAKAFAILDLFTQDRPIWQPDEINEALGYSRPTGYRYVKELVEAGMLQKVAAGRYSLGGRIIELDYQLRQTDPVLLAAMPAMQRLATRTGFDAVLTVMFAGPRVIDIHRVSTNRDLHLAYGRGRPRPVFRSGAPKILLAHLARGPLLKIHAAHADEIAKSGMGKGWPEFRTGLAQIRKAGYYRSIGELEPTLGSVSVPVFNADGDCVAALATVGAVERVAATQPERLLRPLREAAEAIREALASAAARPLEAAQRSRASAKSPPASASSRTKQPRQRRSA